MKGRIAVVGLAVLSMGLCVVPSGARAQARASGKKRSIADDVECSTCHTPAGWRMGGKGLPSGKGFDHSRTGFPLTGRHRATTCVQCHVAGTKITRECVGCHRDAHDGRLSTSCDTCHSAIGWKVTRSLDMHRFTRLPLTGMHVLADCTECHKRANDRQWSSVPSECFACHEKEYRRPDVHPNHQGSATSAPFPHDCAQCHRATGWAPATVDPETLPGRMGLSSAPANHDLRFPISFGVHRQTPCTACHASLAAPRSVRCTGCHAHDPVRVRKQHKQVVALDGSSCVACHPGGMPR